MLEIFIRILIILYVGSHSFGPQIGQICPRKQGHAFYKKPNDNDRGINCRLLKRLQDLDYVYEQNKGDKNNIKINFYQTKEL